MSRTNFGNRLALEKKTHENSSVYTKSIEHIEDPCFVTIATNPKEYIEYFQTQDINKRHTGIRKSENCMNLESFAKRIDLLREIGEYEDKSKIKEKTIAQCRFTVKKTKLFWKLSKTRNLVN